LCKFGGSDWVTASGEVLCSKHCGNGTMVHVVGSEFIFGLLSHLMYVKCAVRMLTHILIKVWEESVTVPSFIPISYLPVLSLVKN